VDKKSDEGSHSFINRKNKTIISKQIQT